MATVRDGTWRVSNELAAAAVVGGGALAVAVIAQLLGVRAVPTAAAPILIVLITGVTAIFAAARLKAGRLQRAVAAAILVGLMAAISRDVVIPFPIAPGGRWERVLLVDRPAIGPCCVLHGPDGAAPVHGGGGS